MTNHFCFTQLQADFTDLCVLQRGGLLTHLSADSWLLFNFIEFSKCQQRLKRICEWIVKFIQFQVERNTSKRSSNSIGEFYNCCEHLRGMIFCSNLTIIKSGDGPNYFWGIPYFKRERNSDQSVLEIATQEVPGPKLGLVLRGCL